MNSTKSLTKFLKSLATKLSSFFKELSIIPINKNFTKMSNNIAKNQKYLGKYADASKNEEQEDNWFEIVRVDNNFGYTADGRKFSFMELDMKHQKIMPAYYSPEIAAELRSIGGNEMFQRGSQPSVESVAVVSPIASNQNPSAVIQSAPSSVSLSEPKSDLEAFIEIAVRNARKRKTESDVNELEVPVVLKFDFDPIKILGAASEICDAKQEDILRAVIKYANIDVSTITDAVVNKLLEPSENE